MERRASTIGKRSKGSEGRREKRLSSTRRASVDISALFEDKESLKDFLSLRCVKKISDVKQQEEVKRQLLDDARERKELNLELVLEAMNVADHEGQREHNILEDIDLRQLGVFLQQSEVKELRMLYSHGCDFSINALRQFKREFCLVGPKNSPSGRMRVPVNLANQISRSSYNKLLLQYQHSFRIDETCLNSPVFTKMHQFCNNCVSLDCEGTEHSGLPVMVTLNTVTLSEVEWITPCPPVWQWKNEGSSTEMQVAAVEDWIGGVVTLSLKKGDHTEQFKLLNPRSNTSKLNDHGIEDLVSLCMNAFTFVGEGELDGREWTQAALDALSERMSSNDRLLSDELKDQLNPSQSAEIEVIRNEVVSSDSEIRSSSRWTPSANEWQVDALSERTKADVKSSFVERLKVEVFINDEKVFKDLISQYLVSRNKTLSKFPSLVAQAGLIESVLSDLVEQELAFNPTVEALFYDFNQGTGKDKRKRMSEQKLARRPSSGRRLSGASLDDKNPAIMPKLGKFCVPPKADDGVNGIDGGNDFYVVKADRDGISGVDSDGVVTINGQVYSVKRDALLDELQSFGQTPTFDDLTDQCMTLWAGEGKVRVKMPQDARPGQALLIRIEHRCESVMQLDTSQDNPVISLSVTCPKNAKPGMTIVVPAPLPYHLKYHGGSFEGWLEEVLSPSLLDVFDKDMLWRCIRQNLLPSATLAEIVHGTGSAPSDLGRRMMPRGFKSYVFSMTTKNGSAASASVLHETAEFVEMRTKMIMGWWHSFFVTWFSGWGLIAVMLTIGMLALFSAGLVDGGWVLTCGEVNGGCFFGERLLVREIVSHSDAKEACKQQGSSLVAIKTALQQVDLVRQVLWDHPASSENTWAALFDPAKSDACPLIWTSLALNTAASSNTTDWEWAAGGSALDYTNWHPDTTVPAGDCMAMDTTNGKWIALPCASASEAACYICESGGYAHEWRGTLSATLWPLVRVWFSLFVVCSVLDIVFLHIRIKAEIEATETTQQLLKIKKITNLFRFGSIRLDALVKQRHQGSEAKRMEATRIEIPYPCGEQRIETGERALVPFLIEGDHQKVFGSAALKAEIQWKWEHYAFNVHAIEFMGYGLFLSLFTILVFRMSSLEFMDVIRNVNTSSVNSNRALSIIVFLLNLRYMCQRIAISSHFRTRSLFGGWNLLDTLLHGLVFFFPAMLLDETPVIVRQCFLAVCVVLAWIKVLHFLRPFQWSGALVAMIVEVLYDMIPFFTMLIIVIIGFSSAFFVLLPRNTLPSATNSTGNQTGNYEAVGIVLFRTFQMMASGEVAGDDFDDYSSRSLWYARVLFIFFIITTMIVLLNLLIAIMADSYEKVHERVETAGLMQKGSLIHDWELLNVKHVKNRAVSMLRSWFYGTPRSGGFLFSVPVATNLLQENVQISPVYGRQDTDFVDTEQGVLSATLATEGAETLAKGRARQNYLRFLKVFFPFIGVVIFSSAIVWLGPWWATFLLLLSQFLLFFQICKARLSAAYSKSIVPPKWLYYMAPRKDGRSAESSWHGVTHSVKAQMQDKFAELEDKMKSQFDQQGKILQDLQNFLNNQNKGESPRTPHVIGVNVEAAPSVPVRVETRRVPSVTDVQASVTVPVVQKLALEKLEQPLQPSVASPLVSSEEDPSVGEL